MPASHQELRMSQGQWQRYDLLAGQCSQEHAPYHNLLLQPHRYLKLILPLLWDLVLGLVFQFFLYIR